MTIEELFKLAADYLVKGDEDALMEILEVIHVLRRFEASEAVRVAKIGQPTE